MTKSTFIYVMYIRTTAAKLWSSLTVDSEFMKQYWFGVHCESQWTEGSEWKMLHGDGQITDTGEIVEAQAPRRLVIRWRHQSKPELVARATSPKGLVPVQKIAPRPTAPWNRHQAGTKALVRAMPR